MKQKILNFLIILGVCGLIATVILIVCKIADFSALWVKYALLGSILFIFAPLNFKFKKYSDIDETIFCLRRTRKAILKLNSEKEIPYVKRLSVHNQLTNSIIMTEELHAKHDFFSLRDDLATLNAIKENFPISEKVVLTKQEIQDYIFAIDSLIDELKKLN